MTSKERAFLRSAAHNMDPIFSVGKSGVTPELTLAVEGSRSERTNKN
jgi:RNA-binding protein